MKNKLILISIIFTEILSAQNLLNVKSPEEFAKEVKENIEKENIGNTPLKYGVVKNKDILWSKIVWEIVDMNERINQPYYYSTPGIAGVNQKCLFDVIVDAVKSGKIKEIYTDDTFSAKTTFATVSSKFKVVDTSDWVKDKIAAGEKITKDDLDVNELRNTDVKLFKIMGMWYVDKKLGEMRYRPLGIAPMGPDMQAINAGISDDSYYDLFWVWYAGARKVLHDHKVFNSKNPSTRISFDDMLNARRFNSIIYKEENMKGHSIKEYIVRDARGQIEENRKIKQSIREVEADLWQQ